MKPSQLLAAPQRLQTIDIATVRVEELRELTGCFTFHAEGGGVMHGMCVWFDCLFEDAAGDSTCTCSRLPFW